MNHRNILVFDLDYTICKDTISNKNVDKFLNMLTDHLGPYGSVYVVTARRQIEDGEKMTLHELLSAHVNKKIVNFLIEYNKRQQRSLEDWFYYNRHEDDIIPAVEKVMRQRGVLNLINRTIPKDDEDDDPESRKMTYYMGIIKMLQLEDIIQKELKYEVPIYLQFFDDSEYNFHAFRVFVEVLKNQLITQFVHFKGGTGEPVFGGKPVNSYHPQIGMFSMEQMPAWHI